MDYDMSIEWDQYMLRYDGYSGSTLEEFVEAGKATYDAATDSYTIFYTGDDGKPASFIAANVFNPVAAPTDADIEADRRGHDRGGAVQERIDGVGEHHDVDVDGWAALVETDWCDHSSGGDGSEDGYQEADEEAGAAAAADDAVAGRDEYGAAAAATYEASRAAAAENTTVEDADPDYRADTGEQTATTRQDITTDQGIGT